MKMKLSISLDDELVKRIDDFADKNFTTRSGFITSACTNYLGSLEALQAVKDMAVATKDLSIAYKKVADTGAIDEELLKQLEDYSRRADFIVENARMP